MKILISDVDGTLVHDNQNISQDNIDWMKELQRQGHKIALCTGRQLFEMKWILNEIPFPYDYLILNNGAQILDRNHRVLYEKKMDAYTGRAILDYVTQFDDLYSFYSDGAVSYGFSHGQCVEHMTNLEEPVDVSFQELYQNAPHFDIISFHQDNQEMTITKACYEYIQKHYGDKLSVYYNLHYVDIVARGCSKGNGMTWLCQHLGINEQDIYAIGDSYNDLSMLQAIRQGYTFKHAHEDIKSMVPRHVHYVHEVIQDMLGGKNNELAR